MPEDFTTGSGRTLSHGRGLPGSLSRDEDHQSQRSVIRIEAGLSCFYRDRRNLFFDVKHCEC
jgi:hypothetical protein